MGLLNLQLFLSRKKKTKLQNSINIPSCSSIVLSRKWLKSPKFFCDWNIQSDNTWVKIMKPWEDVFHQVENNFKGVLKDAKMTVKKYWSPAKERIIPAHQKEKGKKMTPVGSLMLISILFSGWKLCINKYINIISSQLCKWKSICWEIRDDYYPLFKISMATEWIQCWN